MPKISVIVPVYNAEKTLARCVESILAQTEPDFELLLIDDGSTDASGALCDEWAAREPRIRVCHREDGGAGAARNTGLDMARGEWICFADSDDVVSPYYLGLLLGLCERTGCSMGLGGYAVCRPDGADVPAWQPEPGAAETLSAADYYARLYTPLEVLYVVPWAKLYHRSVWEGVRYPALRRCEDEAVIHRLAGAAGRIAVCGAPVYAYLTGENSVMRTARFTPAWLDANAAYADRADFFRAQGLHTLVYLTLRTQLATLLASYAAITDETPDAADWRRHIRRLFDDALRQMWRTPGASRRCCLAMLRRRLAMRPGAQFDRTAILFGGGA